MLTAAITALVLTGAAGGCPGSDLQPSPSNIPQAEAAVLCLTNKVRAANGRRALKSNQLLSAAARQYSNDMTEAHFFSHVSPSGSGFDARLQGSGYLRGADLWLGGENLAWGSSLKATPRMIMQAWLASPHHKANLLGKRFRSIGIGITAVTPFSTTGATYSEILAMRTEKPRRKPIKHRLFN